MARPDRYRQYQAQRHKRLVRNRLGILLDLDPEDEDQRREYDDSAVIEAVESNPEFAAESYEFGSWLPPWKYSGDCTDSARAVLPLLRLLTLRPSRGAVERVYRAYPHAIREFYAHWEHDGADSNNENVDRGGEDRGYCALHIACMSKASAEVVDYLVDEHPAAMEVCNEYRKNPLFLACEHGASSDVIRLLVGRFPDAALSPGYCGLTPLHWCLQNTWEPEVTEENIKCLIEGCPAVLGMNVDDPDQPKGTPLHVACEYDAPAETIKALISAFPAALEIKDACLNTPLHCATTSDAPVEILKTLVDGCPNALHTKDSRARTPLHIAVGNLAPLEKLRLLAEGFPGALNERDSLGKTPLRVAREKEAPKEALTLLETLNAILCQNISDEKVAEMLGQLGGQPWSCGVAPLLDSRPGIVHRLSCHLSVMPLFLARIGQECRMETMLNIIKQGTGIFNPQR